MLKSTKECSLSVNNDSFVKWLVNKLGPVLLGAKPSELLSFLGNDRDLLLKVNRINEIMKGCERLKYRIIELKNKNVKVLFYNEEELKKVLSDKRNRKFLVKHGYAQDCDVIDCINSLLGKIKNGIIPHEIGIFLGYPLKDVIGFIGHPALKYKLNLGWKVYGYVKPSADLYKTINQSKVRIKSLLNTKKPEEVIKILA